ncbi:hypothetical protein NQ317_016801 [Molorchus minor]|uniref:Uncharacterized protein n=1 Tax=Molorchus minor TaxID=1323400 RepID=A0ABQ9J289_9CUCU|nr:hypothetical protein NQ317_016801 [Molorchus minor]
MLFATKTTDRGAAGGKLKVEIKVSRYFSYNKLYFILTHLGAYLLEIAITDLYSVANGSVTAKGIRRKYSILPRLTTKKAICTGNKVMFI